MESFFASLKKKYYYMKEYVSIDETENDLFCPYQKGGIFLRPIESSKGSRRGNIGILLIILCAILVYGFLSVRADAATNADAAEKYVTAGTTVSISLKKTEVGAAYRWQYRTGTSASWKNCSSKTNGYDQRTLKVLGESSKDGYQYRCCIKDKAGKSTFSAVTTLRIFGIKTQPVSRYVKMDAMVSFSVKAAGKNLAWQWQYKKPGGSWTNCSSKMTGYRSGTLQVEATAARNGCQYRCRVKDNSGHSVYSTAATLEVFGISGQPESKYVTAGKTATFQTTAVGKGLTWQWQSRKPGGSWTNCTSKTAGYRSPALKVAADFSRDGYQYRCKVKDNTGKIVTSKAVKLEVFGIKTQPATVYVSLGESANFKIKAYGKSLNYKWQYRLSTSGKWKNVTSAETGTEPSSLSVTAMTGYDGRQYRCVITDANGNTQTSDPATMLVLSADSRLRPCRYGNLYRAEDVFRYWDSLCGRFITKRVLGTVSGYEFPVYTIDCAPGHLNPAYKMDDSWLYQRPRVLIVACIHGDERDPAAGLLSSVWEILNDPGLAEAATNVVWDVIPVANPWGFSHSLVNASGTTVGSLRYYGGTLPEGWTIAENTASSGRGIRYNEAGYDINRDFSDELYDLLLNDVTMPYGFQTQESQMIRDLMQENHYQAVLDIHQAGTQEASATGSVCGFISINNQPGSMTADEYEAVKTAVFSRISRVNHKMDLLCAHTYLDETDLAADHFQIWDGKTSMTLRNYAGGAGGNTSNQAHAAQISACMETSMYCAPFVEKPSLCTRTTRDITTNYILLFLEELADLVQ